MLGCCKDPRLHTLRRQGAFTLVELLAVIAIILIVMSLLIPLLGTIRERAQRLTCVGNTRSLQTGYNLCAMDRDGSLPNGSTGGGDCWVTADGVRGGIVWPYVNEERVYSCPTFPTPANGMKRHYSISWRFSDQSPSWGGYARCATMSGVKKPGSTIVFVEEYDWRQTGVGAYPGPLGAYWGIVPSGVWGDCPPMWHDWGANFSFLDGHAEYRKWVGPKMRTVNIYSWPFCAWSWPGNPLDTDDCDWMIRNGISGFL